MNHTEKSKPHPDTPTTASRFMERFRGLTRAHGECVLTGEKDARGKAKSRNRTVKEAVTEKLWENHLTGKEGLGIVPVDDEGLTNFGAIDVDEYDLNLKALEKKIRSLNLPLIPCQTKSGGAHLYRFLKDRAPAKDLRILLRRCATLLGYSDIEIFPKQDRIEKEDDCGSWINLPYFGDSRRAIHKGKELTPEKFLALADEMAAIDKIELPEVKGLEGAPPCLRTILTNKVIEFRNNTLFNLAVFNRMRGDDLWRETSLKQNETLFDPPLEYKEAKTIVNSVNKKSYRYRCSEPPIKALCDKTQCSECEFGIREKGKIDLGVKLDGLEKHTTEPPTWHLSVNGKPLVLTDTDDLTHQPRFRRACANAFNPPLWPNLLKTKDWDDLIRSLFADCKNVEEDKDAGRTGEIMGEVRVFFSDRAMARHEDELLTGKAYTENGWIYFNSTSLIEWFKKKRLTIGNKEVWNTLKRFGGMTAPERKLKGKVVRLWKIPAQLFTRQDKPFEVPAINDEKPGF